MRRLTLVLLLLALIGPRPALAWGDEGHEIIALIADALLTPGVRHTVRAMLTADPDPLTGHDIASEATWADHYRNADIDLSRARTRQWHFVDIELQAPSLATACFGHPRLPPGIPASLGPAAACVVDKIDQFVTELASPQTLPEERLLALKFLLHLVGDVHQPLHASDDDDRGGNEKRVSAPGLPAGNLHHFWDTVFVRELGPSPVQIAATLIRDLTPARVRDWSGGTPADWAMQSFTLARDDSYGRLPPPSRRGTYRLDGSYFAAALRDTQVQLARAGVRLAALLNRTISDSSATSLRRGASLSVQ